MINVNSIIVGQGISGTLMAHSLIKKGYKVMVIDNCKPNSASRVAAGMFSSMSGKRKTINADMLSKQILAIDTYKQIEIFLNSKFLHQHDIFHIFNSNEEKNEIQEKVDSANILNFNNEFTQDFKNEFGFMKVNNSGWLNCELFIDSYKKYLMNINSIQETGFIYSELKVDEEYFLYDNIRARNIIFCEGYQGRNNPYFSNESIIPCKGDVLTLELINNTREILKRNGVYIIPFTSTTMKAGSTYRWNNDDELINENDLQEIKNKVNEILIDDYKIINHQSAIRPTTKNREVIARQHSHYKNMFMLNGMGTKGVIQAPYWAEYLSKQIKT
jgi:glycine oxidase